MRIITRKIWRAFPELDRFDDAMCTRFVHVAASRPLPRLVRWAVMGLAAVATLAGVGGLLAAVFAMPNPSMLLLIAVAVGGLLAGFVVTMLLRDWMLRRRVRYVIRERGRCLSCGYVLLGLRVGPDSTVTCAECGTPGHVDASLGELATDETGEQVYNPVAPRESAAAIRQRRLIKRTVLGAIGLIVLSYGGWTGWLFWQAREAVRLRKGDVEWRDMTASVQPIPGAATTVAPGTAYADLERLNQWYVISQVSGKVKGFEATQRNAIEDEVLAGMPNISVQVRRPIAFDYTQVTRDGPATTSKSAPSQDAVEMFKIEQAVARRMLDQLKGSDVFKEMERLRAVDVAMRPAPNVQGTPLAPPLIGVLLPECGESRQLARLCSARMHDALAAGDLTEYIAAMDTALALARMLDAQTTMIERLVGTAIEALMLRCVREDIEEYPGIEWTIAARDTLLARSRTVAPTHAIEGENVWAKDCVYYTFAQPWQVQKSTFTGSVAMLGVARGRMGTLRGNIREMDAQTQAWCAHVTSPAYSRTGVGAVGGGGTPTALAALLIPAYAKFASSETQLDIDRAGTLTLLGVDMHRRRTGSVPGSLAVLTSDDLPALPTDPWSGKSFGYVLVDPKTDAHGRTFLVYSVGADMIDDGGKEIVDWMSAPAGSTGDFVINQRRK